MVQAHLEEFIFAFLPVVSTFHSHENIFFTPLTFTRTCLSHLSLLKRLFYTSHFRGNTYSPTSHYHENVHF